MMPPIPYNKWQPLSVAEAAQLFAAAPFSWALAGGYVVEQFLGSSIRTHGDIDLIFFRDEQLQVQRWLAGWALFAADPPGTLRPWGAGEYLPIGIHDLWGHRHEAQAWQLQLMLAEVEGTEWFSRRNNAIRGRREDLMAIYNDLPCVRIEIQLLYKARHHLPKDEVDFQACLPHLSGDQKKWLADHLRLLHPEGHAWIAPLSP